MNINPNLDKIQQDEDILVWKYGVYVDLDNPGNTITDQDRQEFFLSGGWSSLPVVSYREEHPYLEKKIVAIKQICNMTEKETDELLNIIYNTKTKK